MQEKKCACSRGKVSDFSKMAKERKRRYKEKKEFIEKRLIEMEEWITGEDEKTKLACYKAFQEIIEAFFDLAAMLIRDKGKLVEDDHKNIDKLAEIGIINARDSEILHDANGLRNRIVHKYNKIDDNIARESIIALIPYLKNILKKLVQE
jgi:uncharacterized protein YutE (UPF0331/DUF86 family)